MKPGQERQALVMGLVDWFGVALGHLPRVPRMAFARVTSMGLRAISDAVRQSGRTWSADELAHDALLLAEHVEDVAAASSSRR